MSGEVWGPCDHPALRPDRETIGLFVCCQCWHKFTLAEARPAQECSDCGHVIHRTAATWFCPTCGPDSDCGSPTQETK